jgi:hypothetical protein
LLPSFQLPHPSHTLIALIVGDYIHVDDYCDADKNNTKTEKK